MHNYKPAPQKMLMIEQSIVSVTQKILFVRHDVQLVL